jgi:hypothetical protein
MEIEEELSDAVEMPVGGPKDAMENTAAEWRSTVMVEHGCGTMKSLPKNGDNMLWLEASRREDTTVGLLGWCRSAQTKMSGRSDALTTTFPIEVSLKIYF